MILLALVPIVFIWLPIVTKIWVKILVCIASLLTAIFLVNASIQFSDSDELVESMHRLNNNYVQCIDESESETDIWDCVEKHTDLLIDIY